MLLAVVLGLVSESYQSDVNPATLLIFLSWDGIVTYCVVRSVLIILDQRKISGSSKLKLIHSQRLDIRPWDSLARRPEYVQPTRFHQSSACPPLMKHLSLEGCVRAPWWRWYRPESDKSNRHPSLLKGRSSYVAQVILVPPGK